MGYVYPVSDIYVPADWHNHCCERNPPSSEPGTDYASAAGTQILSADAGQVIDVKTSNSSATGRYVTVRLNDGRSTRSLHMKQTWVYVGQLVGRGQALGLSGASGFGSDWYYGSHLHETLWNCQPFTCPTIDFEDFVGGSPPVPPTPEPEPEEEEDMALGGFAYTGTDGKTRRFIVDTGSGFWFEWSDSTIKNAEVQKAFDISEFGGMTQGGRDAMFSAATKARTNAT